MFTVFSLNSTRKQQFPADPLSEPHGPPVVRGPQFGKHWPKRLRTANRPTCTLYWPTQLFVCVCVCVPLMEEYRLTDLSDCELLIDLHVHCIGQRSSLCVCK